MEVFAADSTMSTDTAPPYPWRGTIAEVHQPGENLNTLIEEFKKIDEVNQKALIYAPKPLDPTIVLKSITKSTDIKELPSILCKMNPELEGREKKIKVLFAMRSNTDVQDVVLRISPAPGIDHISNQMIKTAVHHISPVLTKLFNACIGLNYYPEAWRKSAVMIIKKPNKENYKDPKAYRPISLSSNLGKIFESLIHIELLNHINSNNVVHPAQHGFTQEKSTISALQEITKLSLLKRETENTAIVTVDISGAFDNAWHPAILQQLDKANFPATPVWFDPTTNSNGFKFHSIIDEHSLFIHNLKIPTCRNSSIIDLTISNKKSISFVQNWKTTILTNISDHVAITFDIYHNFNRQRTVQNSTWKFIEKDAGWKTFTEKISIQDVDNIITKINHASNIKDIDNIVKTLTQIIKEAAYLSLNVKTRSGNHKTNTYWWDGKLENMKKRFPLY
ncbi:hypothetical protein LAZ67_1005026 [Cordylochernes scorpioides]|uniref:Reverse transcriptase domain-containing protein n=1 Tax=Cordylochernes scorpioides TaxID=51811 RepID=A0ABY6K2Q9_9ARAC|nr:hypothetical protein LAZ67_1005026 [Cordylochernes scorpioides]